MSATVVNVQDGAPTLTLPAGAVESCTCACARMLSDSPVCELWEWAVDRTRVQLPISAADADGDPVQVTYLPAPISGSQQTVFPPACYALFNVPASGLPVQVTVDDGVGRVQSSTVLKATCSITGLECTP